MREPNEITPEQAMEFLARAGKRIAELEARVGDLEGRLRVLRPYFEDHSGEALMIDAALRKADFHNQQLSS